MRRLERRVANAKLKLLRETDEAVTHDTKACLDTLRAGLEATNDGEVDSRERRMSAEALLRHHRDVVKLADPKMPAIQVNQDNRQQTAIQIPPEWLEDPAKREAIMRLTEQALNGSS